MRDARKAVRWTAFSPERAEPSFGLPLRRTTGVVARLLKRAGLDGPVPDVSTPCPRQKMLAVQLPRRGAGGPRHLLVDGTGIKVRGEG